MSGCQEYELLNRRNLLRGLGALTLTTIGLSSAVAQVVASAQPRSEKTLVVLFLRGGMDGLHAVAPVGDDDYRKARPGLALAHDPNLMLNDQFQLNKALTGLMPLYREGKLSVVHAVGSEDQSHSHFEAMNAMELGKATNRDAEQSGWIARYLTTTQTSPKPLRAISISQTMPDSFRGGLSSMAIPGLEAFSFQDGALSLHHLNELYHGAHDTFGVAGKETLNVLAKLEKRPVSSQGQYPNHELGRAFADAAYLIQSDIGVEIIALEETGWDYHVAQTGMATHLGFVGDSISAFFNQLGKKSKDVTLIVMTEFGRRLEENDGLGTDHGSASCMFVCGGTTKGGKVFVDWPGLKPSQLSGPGDLQVTTDYRTVLSESLQWLDPKASTKAIFPDLEAKPVGVFG